ncbi:MAG: S-layer homology domain-containing protein [Candidatus Peribacteria bacterium]|jgi:hypothetical protein|nr:S-layer homology domain-containing protein [Candidatus Peribacteria bacterium]
MPTFEDARISDSITRAEMAKMISVYANAFTPNKGLQPLAGQDTVRPLAECENFTDLNQTNPELQSHIIQACELGLMGYYANGKDTQPAFRPNDTITRAEV